MARPFPHAPHTTPVTQPRTSLRAPIHNPYDKFTQSEFDAWIGDIKGSLRRALGYEEASQSDSEQHAPQAALDVKRDVYEPSQGHDPYLDDTVMEDSFAEVIARRETKGKARDPREGPGFGAQDAPIELLSDSDNEEDEAHSQEDGFTENEEDAGQSPPSMSDIHTMGAETAEEEETGASDEGVEQLYEPERGSSPPEPYNSGSQIVFDEEQEAPSNEAHRYFRDIYDDNFGGQAVEESENVESVDVGSHYVNNVFPFDSRYPTIYEPELEADDAYDGEDGGSEEDELEEDEEVQPIRHAHPRPEPEVYEVLDSDEAESEEELDQDFLPHDSQRLDLGPVPMSYPQTNSGAYTGEFFSGGDVHSASDDAGPDVVPSLLDDTDRMYDDVGVGQVALEEDPLSPPPLGITDELPPVELYDTWAAPRTFAEDLYTGGDAPDGAFAELCATPSHLDDTRRDFFNMHSQGNALPEDEGVVQDDRGSSPMRNTSQQVRPEGSLDFVDDVESYNLPASFENAQVQRTEDHLFREALSAAADIPVEPLDRDEHRTGTEKSNELIEPIEPTVTIEPIEPTVTIEPIEPTVTIEPIEPTVTIEPPTDHSSVEPNQIRDSTPALPDVQDVLDVVASCPEPVSSELYEVALPDSSSGQAQGSLDFLDSLDVSAMSDDVVLDDSLFAEQPAKADFGSLPLTPTGDEDMQPTLNRQEVFNFDEIPPENVTDALSKLPEDDGITGYTVREAVLASEGIHRDGDAMSVTTDVPENPAADKVDDVDMPFSRGELETTSSLEVPKKASEAPENSELPLSVTDGDVGISKAEEQPVVEKIEDSGPLPVEVTTEIAILSKATTNADLEVAFGDQQECLLPNLSEHLHAVVVKGHDLPDIPMPVIANPDVIDPASGGPTSPFLMEEPPSYTPGGTFTGGYFDHPIAPSTTTSQPPTPIAIPQPQKLPPAFAMRLRLKQQQALEADSEDSIFTPKEGTSPAPPASPAAAITEDDTYSVIDNDNQGAVSPAIEIDVPMQTVTPSTSACAAEASLPQNHSGAIGPAEQLEPGLEVPSFERPTSTTSYAHFSVGIDTWPALLSAPKNAQYSDAHDAESNLVGVSAKLSSSEEDSSPAGDEEEDALLVADKRRSSPMEVEAKRNLGEFSKPSTDSSSIGKETEPLAEPSTVEEVSPGPDVSTPTQPENCERRHENVSNNEWQTSASKSLNDQAVFRLQSRSPSIASSDTPLIIPYETDPPSDDLEAADEVTSNTQDVAFVEPSAVSDNERPMSPTSELNQVHQSNDKHLTDVQELADNADETIVHDLEQKEERSSPVADVDTHAFDDSNASIRPEASKTYSLPEVPDIQRGNIYHQHSRQAPTNVTALPGRPIIAPSVARPPSSIPLPSPSESIITLEEPISAPADIVPSETEPKGATLVHPGPSTHRSIVASSPVTRSRCKFHKISVEKEDYGPRIFFIVPGCSLVNREFMEEQDIIDHGSATVEDTYKMEADIASLDMSAELLSNLRLLVGVEREEEIFYLPQPSIPISRRRERKLDSIKRRDSMISISRAPARRSSLANSVFLSSRAQKRARDEAEASSRAGSPKVDKKQRTESASAFNSESELTDSLTDHGSDSEEEYDQLASGYQPTSEDELRSPRSTQSFTPKSGPSRLPSRAQVVKNVSWRGTTDSSVGQSISDTEGSGRSKRQTARAAKADTRSQSTNATSAKSTTGKATSSAKALERTATENLSSRSSQRLVLRLPVRKSASLAEPHKESEKNALKRQPTDDENAPANKKKPKLA